MSKKKSRGYYMYYPHSHQVGNRWVRDQEPCRGRIPVDNVKKARMRKKFPHCPRCGGPTALVDKELNSKVSNLFSLILNEDSKRGEL